MNLILLQQILLENPALSAMAGTLVLLLPLMVVSRIRLMRRARRERAEMQAGIEELRREQHATAELAVRIGQRLRHAEEQLGQMHTRIEGMKVQEQAPDPGHAYAQAIRLVRKGADASRLVADFGLSRGEAELVALLHGQRKTG